VQHSDIRKYYNQSYYKNADDKYIGKSHFCRLARKISLSEGEKLLDVACGTGVWLRVAQWSGASVTGIDISNVAVDICRNALPDAEVVVGVAEELPWPSSTFDIVTCLGSLEHFLNKRAALGEIVRVSKQGGRVLILVPNAGFLTRKLGLYSGTNQANIKEDVLSLESWQGLIESAGLTIIKRWKDLHVLSFSWATKGKWYLWPARIIQALLLVVWPLKWQYQVYFYCKVNTRTDA